MREAPILRFELFGIKSDILTKPVVEVNKDEATKAPEEGDASKKETPAKVPEEVKK